MIPLEHIHPMIVHFPIVLMFLVAGLDLLIVVRGGSLSDSSTLARLATGLLVLAGVSAVAAFLFGDMAYDIATSAGVSEASLETHEGLGTTTMAVFVALALVRLAARWRGIGLAGGKGWVVTMASIAGVVLVVLTAYFGGQLVYQLGVNVAQLKP